MGLKTRHGSGIVIQYYEQESGPVMYGIYQHRNYSMEESGISADGKTWLTYSKLVKIPETASHSCTGTHCMNSLQLRKPGGQDSQSITPYITKEDAVPAVQSQGLLDGPQ